MEIKDRLKELRDNYFEKHGKSPWLEDNDENCKVTIETSNNDIDKFLRKVDNIDESFKEMINLVENMRKIHLNETEINERVQRDLDDLNINFKIFSKKIKENIIDMQGEILILEKENLQKTAIYRIKQIQVARLQKTVSNILSDYNDAQVKYKEKCKKFLKRQIQITGLDIKDEQMDEMLENNASDVFIQNIIHDTKVAKQQMAEIQSRHEDILKIEKSVRELAEMFQDMATMVSQQGEFINIIENHVQNTYEYVDDASKKLEEAHKLQKKARKKKIIILIIVILLIIGIIGAIVYFSK